MLNFATIPQTYKMRESPTICGELWRAYSWLVRSRLPTTGCLSEPKKKRPIHPNYRTACSRYFACHQARTIGINTDHQSDFGGPFGSPGDRCSCGYMNRWMCFDRFCAGSLNLSGPRAVTPPMSPSFNLPHIRPCASANTPKDKHNISK